MQYSDIDEWLESISLENAHTIFREVELSFVNLTQKLTNMSLKEKLSLQTPKIYNSLCQNSQSKTIVKTTRRPSKLGQLLCQNNKQDPSIQLWLDKMVFNPPNSSCNFEVLPMSIRKSNNKVKHKSQLRPNGIVAWGIVCYKMVMRLDRALVEKGFAPSRERAKERVERGDISVNGVVVTKPSHDVSEQDTIDVAGEGLRWVSRAGQKLEHALAFWKVDVSRKTCLDIGASTGGFTEVLLERGAKKVYALDVGHGQLHSKLREDSRVVNMEGTHIKDVSRKDVTDDIGCIVIDVSFISLEKVLPKAFELLAPAGVLVALIKPQFEVGKDNTKKGIVVDKQKQEDAVRRVCEYARVAGFDVRGTTESPITGGDGNEEFLMYATK